MELIRPRLTDHYGVDVAQSSLDFAIPFLSEDLPLYADPFLLWKSPSQQDQALHGAMLTSFNRLGWSIRRGRLDEVTSTLVRLSEADEVGLGSSGTRRGKRIGSGTAAEIAGLFQSIENYAREGFSHFEEVQFFVDGIGRDRISDFTCNFLKSFLIDFTIEQCDLIHLPRADVVVPELYDFQSHSIKDGC